MPKVTPRKNYIFLKKIRFHSWISKYSKYNLYLEHFAKECEVWTLKYPYLKVVLKPGPTLKKMFPECVLFYFKLPKYASD